MEDAKLTRERPFSDIERDLLEYLNKMESRRLEITTSGVLNFLMALANNDEDKARFFLSTFIAISTGSSAEGIAADMLSPESLKWTEEESLFSRLVYHLKSKISFDGEGSFGSEGVRDDYMNEIYRRDQDSTIAEG